MKVQTFLKVQYQPHNIIPCLDFPAQETPKLKISKFSNEWLMIKMMLEKRHTNVKKKMCLFNNKLLNNDYILIIFVSNNSLLKAKHK